jgi:lipopolysaccharide/colanic/teichoic acid biosynthesis glycosyltransferase
MQTARIAAPAPLSAELLALEDELLHGTPAEAPTERATGAPSRGFAVKYAIDRLVAAMLLLVLLPVLLVIAAAVLATSRGPLLHRQVRVGQGGRRFEILKFRSMLPAPADGAGFVPAAGAAPGGVEGVDRRTRVGKVLRAFSLDELPQLLNVLRGDMSLIGPRPERPEFDERFCVEVDGYADRLRVKPGLTGLAQVRGLRGQTSIADRAAADNEYIDRWSPLAELAIWVRTPIAVLTPAE